MSLTTVLGFWSFLNRELFPSWTHSAFHLSSYDKKKNAKSAANFDQYWQSYMYAETNKQLTWGEFCYLPGTLCPFTEKVASQNSAQRKDNKVGNKTGCKKERQKEKKECEAKTLKTDPPPPKKKTNFVSKCSKDINLINFIQLAKKFALSVKSLFFSHSHVN